jgi:hypothetical protein
VAEQHHFRRPKTAAAKPSGEATTFTEPPLGKPAVRGITLVKKLSLLPKTKLSAL